MKPPILSSGASGVRRKLQGAAVQRGERIGVGHVGSQVERVLHQRVVGDLGQIRTFARRKLQWQLLHHLSISRGHEIDRDARVLRFELIDQFAHPLHVVRIVVGEDEGDVLGLRGCRKAAEPDWGRGDRGDAA